MDQSMQMKLSPLRRAAHSLRETLETLRLSGRLGAVLPSNTARNQLLRRIRDISRNVQCPHNHSEILAFGIEILSLPPSVKGCVIEAGCYKGGSTAKFSLFAKLAGRELVGFDSFQGLPENDESHEQSILGHSIEGHFRGGNYCGRLDEVRANVEKYGETDVCRFVEGWFQETLPRFKEPIAAAYLDVDLAQSTRTCLKHLYPLISSGGILYSQDGDFPLVIDVFADSSFWEQEVGCARPEVEGLGGRKLLRIQKPD